MELLAAGENLDSNDQEMDGWFFKRLMFFYISYWINNLIQYIYNLYILDVFVPSNFELDMQELGYLSTSQIDRVSQSVRLSRGIFEF